MQYFLLTLTAAAVGGLISLRLKLPAGAMIGSMIAVVIFNIVTGWAYIPQNMNKIIQIFAGALIGSRMSKKDFVGFKDIVFAALLLVFGMIILNFTVGLAINRLSGLDLTTALFASAPGGLQDMALIADDMGADAPKVAILQLVRLMSVISFFPVLLKYFCVHFINKGKNTGDLDNQNSNMPIVGSGTSDASVLSENVLMGHQKVKKVSYTLAVAVIGGTAGILLKIPAGAMIGSMIAVVVTNIFFVHAFIPKNMRNFTQIAAGAIIGSRMTRQDIMGLNDILIPGIVLVVSLIILNFAFGFIISRLTKLDIATSLFASAPGGLSDMALIADELGADAPKVAILQLMRLLSVISIFPTLIKFFSEYFM